MYDARQTCTAATVSAAAGAAEIDQKTKSGLLKACNFKIIEIFNAEKIQQRQFFVVESARNSSYRTCPDILVVQLGYWSGSRAVWVVWHETQYSETGGSMDLALLLFPVAITCCC